MTEEILASKYLRSVAVFGGSFDPIHFGHLRTAESIREEFNLDKVIFMPAGRPPHKVNASLNDKEHRYLMTVLATKSNPFFHVSRLELDKAGYSYTVDTISQIKGMCLRGVNIYFVVGADSLVEMENWKNPEELFSLCRIIAAGRPGTDERLVQCGIKALKEKYGANIYFTNREQHSISSTDIRRKVRNGISIKYLVPGEVEQYIKDNRLYVGREFNGKPDFASLDKYLKDNLSEKRYRHTMNVADTAASLAQNYGADRDKAYTAGLLHDVAKELSTDKKLELCKEYGIYVDEIMKRQPELLHSFLSAAMAKSIFGVVDVDTLNAVRYHTTGRAGMSDLEKILLLADIIEPGREDTVAKLRGIAYSDLDKAVCEAIRVKLKFTEARGRVIHPLSLETLKYYGGEYK